MSYLFRQTAEGYTTNKFETKNHRIELSGNERTITPGAERVAGKAAPGDYIELHMLDAESRERAERPISEMGVSLTLDEAESFGRWLLETVSFVRGNRSV